MFDPADKVSVELQAGEWNELLAATNPNAWQAIIEALIALLRQQQRVTLLTARIVEQANAQGQAQPDPVPASIGLDQRPNGELPASEAGA